MHPSRFDSAQEMALFWLAPGMLPDATPSIAGVVNDRCVFGDYLLQRGQSSVRVFVSGSYVKYGNRGYCRCFASSFCLASRAISILVPQPVRIFFLVVHRAMRVPDAWKQGPAAGQAAASFFLSRLVDARCRIRCCVRPGQYPCEFDAGTRWVIARAVPRLKGHPLYFKNLAVLSWLGISSVRLVAVLALEFDLNP